MGNNLSSGNYKSLGPIRKGTAHIIKENKPIVVPIIIDGFRRSFDKKVFLLKKWYKTINENKKPLKINYEASIENITKK
ncbi:MAG: hypothetical protein CM15mP112_07520 [Flavobacteriales bacterium]|nr:MAG: hypothetical protein CM15mP112_07520 [Flavobacteriales bacterium]